jgi:hypothetical protein
MDICNSNRFWFKCSLIIHIYVDFLLNKMSLNLVNAYKLKSSNFVNKSWYQNLFVIF